MVLVLGAGACSRRASPPSGDVEYAPPDRSFTARLPKGWKVDEYQGETSRAAFFGPPEGPRAFSESIGVYFHKAGERYKTPDDYLAAQSALGRVISPLPGGADAAKSLDISIERQIDDVHSGLQRTRTHSFLIPASGGFFALEHTYPAGENPSPVFEEFQASFRPVPSGK